MPKKVKVHCKNCGAVTVFPTNADWERESLGFCPGCYRTWRKNKITPPDAPPKTIYDRKPFASWPPDRDERYDEYH